MTYLYFQSADPCDGVCNDMEEDIANEEESHNEIFEHIDEEETSNTADSNIIVIDEDAHSEYRKPEATDMIYIDDSPEGNSKHTPDIDIGRVEFDP